MCTRAACRITLDNEQLVEFGLFTRTVFKLSYRVEAVDTVFLTDQFFFSSCSLAHFCGKQRFFEYYFRNALVFLEKRGKLLGCDCVAGNFRFRISQFGLGLTFKLNVVHFNRQHDGYSLAVIVAKKIFILFFQQTHIASGVVKNFGKRALKSGFVSASLAGGNIIDVREKVFGVRVGILKSDFEVYSVFFPFKIYRRIECRIFCLVEIFDKIDYTAFIAVFAHQMSVAHWNAFVF